MRGNETQVRENERGGERDTRRQAGGDGLGKDKLNTRTGGQVETNEGEKKKTLGTDRTKQSRFRILALFPRRFMSGPVLGHLRWTVVYRVSTPRCKQTAVLLDLALLLRSWLRRSSSSGNPASRLSPTDCHRSSAGAAHRFYSDEKIWTVFLTRRKQKSRMLF